jgi:hypothetical protein
MQVSFLRIQPPQKKSGSSGFRAAHRGGPVVRKIHADRTIPRIRAQRWSANVARDAQKKAPRKESPAPSHVYGISLETVCYAAILFNTICPPMRFPLGTFYVFGLFRFPLI